MLQLSHYILLAVILTIIGWGFKRAAVIAGYSSVEKSKLLKGYWLFIVLWVGYVSLMAGSDFLADFSLPPKFVLFIILPAFIIIGTFFSIKKFAKIIISFPIALTVYYQSFRIIVELLIWWIYKEGMVPEIVTFEGRNMDVLVGLSAPVVGYLAYHMKWLSHKMVILWNVIGLLILANIVLIFISLIVKQGMWGFDTIPLSLDFPRLPYVFIAGAFMPTAVFMHIFSIRKSMQALKGKAVTN